MVTVQTARFYFGLGLVLLGAFLVFYEEFLKAIERILKFLRRILSFTQPYRAEGMEVKIETKGIAEAIKALDNFFGKKGNMKAGAILIITGYFLMKG